jgi:hypothetical protein
MAMRNLGPRPVLCHGVSGNQVRLTRTGHPFPPTLPTMARVLAVLPSPRWRGCLVRLPAMVPRPPRPAESAYTVAANVGLRGSPGESGRIGPVGVPPRVQRGTGTRPDLQ